MAPRWPFRRASGARPDTPAPASDEPTEESIGAAASRLPVPENAERHAYPMLRVLLAALLISGSLNLVLAGMLLWMFPLQRVVPYVMQVHPHGRQVIDLQPLEGASVPTAKVIVEGVITRYLEERLAVIEWPDEMRRRWTHPRSFLATHTKREEYDAFVKSVEGALADMETEPYHREVEILDMRRLPGHTGWAYEVDLELVDSKGILKDSEPVRSRWNVTLQIERWNYKTGQPTIETARLNAFGLHVSRFVLRQRQPLQGETNP